VVGSAAAIQRSPSGPVPNLAAAVISTDAIAFTADSNGGR